MTEVGYAINVIVVQWMFVQELLGGGEAAYYYLLAIALFSLWGQRVKGGVYATRRLYVTLVFPMYWASLLFLPFLSRPLLAIVMIEVLMTVKVGVGMSVCMHRYAAHAAFKCGSATSFFLQIVGCLANQGGALWWAANHRCHHKYCDADDHEKDPHSPQLDGAANAFAFLADHKELKEAWVPAHLDSPASRILDTWASVVVTAEYVLAYHLGGVEALFISYVSGWMCQVGSLWFNVLNHLPLPGEKSAYNMRGQTTAVCYAVDDASSDHMEMPNIFFAAINAKMWQPAFIGESTHGHHHAYANLAHRPGIDLPYHIFVRPLWALGLISSVKTEGRELLQPREANGPKGVKAG